MVGDPNQISEVRHFEFTEYFRFILFGGVNRDPEFLHDLSVVGSSHQQRMNLPLARRKVLQLGGYSSGTSLTCQKFCIEYQRMFKRSVDSPER